MPNISLQNPISVLRRPHQMVLAIPDRMAASFIIPHPRSITQPTYPSPKGEGFADPLSGTLKRLDGTAKGDWDVGIALDIFEEAQRCDTIVLASGDGDFCILLERIKQRFDTRTEIYGVPQLTSNQLIASASRFVPIDKNLLLK